MSTQPNTKDRAKLEQKPSSEAKSKKINADQPQEPSKSNRPMSMKPKNRHVRGTD